VNNIEKFQEDYRAWSPEQKAQHRAKINAALRRPEVRAKISKGVKDAWGAGAHRNVRYTKSAAVNLAKARLVGQAKMRGAEGFGKTRRGAPDHASCKAWCVLSPVGVQYRFTNLRTWCRQNEALFTDPTPGAKLPLWLRAACGIKQQGHAVGRLCSWCGWVLQKVWERRDPLERNPEPLLVS